MFKNMYVDVLKYVCLGIGDWGLGPIPNPQSPNIIYINLIFLLENQINNIK